MGDQASLVHKLMAYPLLNNLLFQIIYERVGLSNYLNSWITRGLLTQNTLLPWGGEGEAKLPKTSRPGSKALDRPFAQAHIA